MIFLRPVRFAVFALCFLSVATQAAKKNVLIIQTDEHNFRTLGVYRDLMSREQAFVWGDGVKVDTPHIDRIGKEGAVCTSYYATSPVCTPSRASLMSGLYPQNTGSIQNDRPLLDSVVTFAEVLRRKGYATGYAGKWHLDGTAKPGWGPKRKFGFEDNRYMFNRGHWKKLEITEEGPRVGAKNKKGEPAYGVDGADEKTFTTDFLTDRTIDFINTHKDEPFCYMVSIPDPHGPNTVRAPYDTMFDPAQFRQPPSALAKGKGLPSFMDVVQDRFKASLMAQYFGMVKCIDDNMGRVFETLEKHGILDDTIIVFTSDHGDMCGELGRHNKGIPCEGSARIPFLIRAPGLVKKGAVIHEALGTVDFKPTLLGLLDESSPEKVEGRDASGLFKKGKAPKAWEDMAFVRIESAAKAWFAAFTKRHKLVISRSDDPALFDLKNDPNELNNVFADPKNRGLIRDLAKGLSDYAESTKDPHLSYESIKADLKWAVSDSETYVPSERKPSAAKKKRGKSK